MPLKGKRHGTRSKKYTKGTARTNPGFRKKVLSVIKRQQEIKINVQSQDSQAIELYNSTGPVNMSYLDLNSYVIGSIPQGTDANSRIGTKINIRSWVIKGNLIMNNYSNTQQPAYIKAIVLKSKTNKDYSTQFFDDLFERNSAFAPFNTLSDIYTPIDKDNYTVYAQRVFKLGPSTGAHPNNDFQVSRMFSINLTKDFKKFEWKDDGTGLPSSPSNLYMIFVGCYADNTPITFGPYTGPQVIYSFTSCVRFTDD